MRKTDIVTRGFTAHWKHRAEDSRVMFATSDDGETCITSEGYAMFKFPVHLWDLVTRGLPFCKKAPAPGRVFWVVNGHREERPDESAKRWFKQWDEFFRDSNAPAADTELIQMHKSPGALYPVRIFSTGKTLVSIQTAFLEMFGPCVPSIYWSNDREKYPGLLISGAPELCEAFILPVKHDIPKNLAAALLTVDFPRVNGEGWKK